MKKNFLRAAAGLLFFFLINPAVSQTQTREPSVAGAFYPADPKTLQSDIGRYLDAAGPQESTGELTGIIVPHAGYEYSGSVAAYGYKLLQNKHYDTVIILGPYHRARFRGASIWAGGVWKTPLGEVPVDSELAQALLRENPEFHFLPAAHEGEHSLEVQIPFLQTVLHEFKIVPVAISDSSPENTLRLAAAIVKHLGDKKILIVVSTDMSHYFPVEQAERMDASTLGFLAGVDPDGLAVLFSQGKGELCGAAAALTFLQIVKKLGGTEIRILKHGTSADATGDGSSVVGYAALAFFRGGQENPDSEKIPHEVPAQKEEINSAQQKELLDLARKTLEDFLGSRTIPEPQVTDSALLENKAVFVTLRKKGELRGCVGHTTAYMPLYLAVQKMAIEAAIHDSRFLPVQAEELKELTIEVSLLSPARRIKNADEIVMGRDGVFLKNGASGGLFLPQVALETGWSREIFLSELCTQKAGLKADCAHDPKTELWVFTVQEFRE